MDRTLNSHSVLLIDDDEVSREVLTLLLRGAGYDVESAESGVAALNQLSRRQQDPPNTILTDLQMPGLAGVDLAHRLRAASQSSLLLVMSGSTPADAILGVFDGFLLKPFTMEQFADALHSPRGAAAPPLQDSASESRIPALDDRIFRQMTTLMPPDQLHQLYAMCLQDVENRLDRMRIAASHHNEEIFRREAHSIKGGAGMLGAVEIQSLAAKLETQSPIPANHLASLNEILLAAERLRRILIAREDRAK